MSTTNSFPLPTLIEICDHDHDCDCYIAHYAVSRIEGHFWNPQGGLFYYVQWDGYPENIDPWVSEVDMIQGPMLVEYWDNVVASRFTRISQIQAIQQLPNELIWLVAKMCEQVPQWY